MAVRQEKNKKKWTKDGRSWYFDEYYHDQYGNIKEYKSKLYMSERIATRERKKWLQDLNIKIENKSNQDNNILFKQLYLEWFDIKKMTLKSSTCYRLKKNLDKNILEYFGVYKLNNITETIINNWLNQLKNKFNSISYPNSLIGYFREIGFMSSF